MADTTVIAQCPGRAQRTIVVQLDDERYPGNGGVVIAVGVSLKDFLAIATDRDGGVDQSLRFWTSTENTQIGERAWLARPTEKA